MAQGDVVTLVPTSVAAGSTLDIKPGANIEWVIHNIQVSGQAELAKTDGSNPITIDSLSAAGEWTNQEKHATNTVWWRVKNTGGGAIYVSYDGVQTK